MLSRGGPVDAGRLRRALRTLHHRGPDGQKTWLSADGQVALGHARLSIIDLATGDQPIANEDESVRIVANGEFYDYERVQAELERGGHRLRTRSDSEIALHLYEDLGTQGVHRLRGEYAFVLWDARSRKLIAVRDRFGVKPLFYAEHDGVLYLASEMKALFAAGVPAQWNPEVSYFGTFLSPPGYTAFTGVYSVPPGHYLMADAERISTTQYWDCEYPVTGTSDQQMSDGDYIDGFRSVLDDAVRLRLRADVPVGCYLSGGIDSCAVLGLAARHRADPIRAFTLRFEHADYDEGGIAERMARQAGAEWVPVSIDQTALADNFSDAIYHAEAVCVNAHFVAKYLLSRAVRDAGFKVVLTGEGSDEILAGYAHFREDMLRYDSAGQDPAEVERLIGELNAANPVSQGILLTDDHSRNSALMSRLLGFNPTMYAPFFARLARMEPLFNADFLAPFAGRDPASLLLDNLDVKRRLARRAPVHQSLYLWAKTILPTYILVLLGDRMEMAHSIEGRVPFLDHEVAEFLFRTPVHLKIRGLTEKYILREAARDVLTDEVYRRQKHPFLSPPDSTDQPSRMTALVQDTLRSHLVDSIPFLDSRAVRALADRLDGMSSAERGKIDSDVMQLVSWVVMHERFVMAGAT